VIELTALNALPPTQFVEAMAGIFEHSAWIPERVAAQRPFATRLDLLDAMRRIVDEGTPEEQLALINAHPKLGARGRARQQLTSASSAEQKRAGLDACSDEQFAQLERINASYLARFGFPFILAVRGHDPPAILAQIEQRLAQTRAQEIRTAIHQIGLIAGYRLADLVVSRPEGEAQAMLDRLSGVGAASLLREWMLAAGLTVSQTDSSTLIGTIGADHPDASTLILGLHCDARTGALSYDGQLGCTCAIALLQQLKGQGRDPGAQITIVTRPHDPARGSLRPLSGLDPRRTIAICGIDPRIAQNRAILDALAGAKISRGIIAQVVQICAQPETELTLERVTGALQEFLLHTH
jgi:N-carbamoyl-L-amino-acid hydrolase